MDETSSLPDGYRALRELGRGGVGVVLEALAPDGRRVALKIAHADVMPWRHEWLRREASLAARLRHPHVVELLTSGELDDGRPFLVFEHVQGRSLEECADTLDGPAIVRLGRELLGALGYAHDAGVLHLDVSPSNVLLRDRDGAAQLTDFGLAMPRDGRAGLPVVVAGTPGYLSPEQAIGCGIGERSDLYGLGAVLYRVMAGHPPHGGADSTEILRHTLYGEVLPLRPRVRGVPWGIVRLVEALVARDPERRPASAAATLAWWRSAESGPESPPEAFEPTPLVPARRDSVLATLAVPAGPTAPRRGLGSDHDERTEWVAAPSLPPSRESRLEHTLEGERATAAERVAARLREGGLVRAHGPRASGRSTWVRGLVDVLHRDDARVVRVVGRRGFASPPLEGLAALVARWLDAEVGPPFAVAERLALELDARLDGVLPNDARRTVRDALVEGLLAKARATRVGSAIPHLVRALDALADGPRPVVWVVDDADELDASTLEVLHGVRRLGVLLVGSRGDEDSIALPPFPVTAPTTEGLDDEALAVLEACRAFPGEAPRRALAPLASLALGRPVAVERVDELVARELLIPVEPAIARAERWVRARTSGEASGEVAGHAAAWLCRECFDPSPSVQAASASLAERAGDRRRAAYAYAEAGRRAAAMRLPNADALLNQALALGEDDVLDRAALEVELAQRHLDGGRVEDAARLALGAAGLAKEQARPVLRARALRIAATARSATRRTMEAVALLEAGIETLGDDGDPTELALALASLGWQLGYVLDRNAEGIALGRRALEVAARIDAPAFQASLCGRLGANLLRAGDWDGQLGTNLRDLGLSLLAEDPLGVARAHVNLGVCYTNRGLLALARAHTEAALELANLHGAALAGLVATNNLAALACDEGDLDRAERLAEEALARAEARKVSASAETWATLARVRFARGELEGARDALRAMEDVAHESERPLVARVAAMLTAPDDACHRLEEALAAGVDDPYDLATTCLALAFALERAGRPDDALRADACSTLEALGADVVIERRRARGPRA
ncbi:MAG: protein kinase [Sandaracinus sp.]|nr:protein kinase [Sandaracinus sp.]